MLHYYMYAHIQCDIAYHIQYIAKVYIQYLQNNNNNNLWSNLNYYKLFKIVSPKGSMKMFIIEKKVF